MNHQILRFAAVALLALAMAGCSSSESSSKAGSGAKGGALLGAGIGLFLGALTGDSEVAVAATAVGAAAGAGQGAYEGWRQDQDDQRTQEITAAIRESNASGGQQNLDAEGRAREELTRFLGVWRMEGWAQEPGEERINVTAQINGDIEMGLFVELSYIDFKASGFDQQIWGTSTLGYDADTGYSISTRFNTVPEPLRNESGTFDAGGRRFTFPGDGYTVEIKFENPDRYRVETIVGNEVVESYTVTRT